MTTNNLAQLLADLASLLRSQGLIQHADWIDEKKLRIESGAHSRHEAIADIRRVVTAGMGGLNDIELSRNAQEPGGLSPHGQLELLIADLYIATSE